MTTEQKLKLCLAYIREQARAECYVMCDCQYEATKVLAKIEAGNVPDEK